MKAVIYLARFSLILTCLIFILGLFFRAFYYWKLPVTPGDPYGIADINELEIYIFLVAASIFSGVLGISLILIKRFKQKALGIALLIISLIAVPIYNFIHPVVSRLTAP